MDAGSEKRLVARVKKGESVAFREFVEQYQSRVYRTVISMISNREDAKDITQEVFLKAFDAMESFRGGCSVNTWLYRIAVNLCIDQMRSQGSKPVMSCIDTIVEKEGEGDDSFMQSPENPLGNAIWVETIKSVSAALDELTPEHKAIIILREVDGLSYDEIAETLGIGMGTVMSRLHYARSQLRKRLEPLSKEREVPNEKTGNFFKVASRTA